MTKKSKAIEIHSMFAACEFTVFAKKSDTNNCILSSVNTPSRKMKRLCGVNNDSSNACLMCEPSAEIEKVKDNILAKQK